MTDDIITPAGTGSNIAPGEQVNIEFMGDGQPAGNDSVSVNMQNMPKGVTTANQQPTPTTTPNQNDTTVPAEVSPGLVTPTTENPNEASVPTSDSSDPRTKARLAMEGAVYTAKREEREKKEDIAEEKQKLETELGEIAQKKAVLEDNWINLDRQRNEIKKKLDPIIQKETETETTEAQVETEEKNTGLAQQKQQLEKRKWLLEDERRKLEESRWVLDEQLSKIEEAIESNTNQYRQLLNKEEEIYSGLDQLNAGQL